MLSGRTLYGTTYGGGALGEVTVFKLELPPEFTSWQWGTNGMQVQLSGASGHSIEIYASTNLTDWTLVARLLNESGQVGYMDLGAGNYARRFYRAVQLP